MVRAASPDEELIWGVGLRPSLPVHSAQPSPFPRRHWKNLLHRQILRPRQLGSKTVEDTVGRKGGLQRGVLAFGVPRAEAVTMGGMSTNCWRASLVPSDPETGFSTTYSFTRFPYSCYLGDSAYSGGSI